MTYAHSPRVSVIIPSYQAAKTIERAIRSVLSQTYSDLEILVIDDVSTDETKQILLEIAKEDQRVTYIYSDRKLGPANARNLGITHSKGEIVAFLDADDEWILDTKLAKQVDILANNPQVGTVFSDCWIVDEITKVKRLYSSVNKIYTRDLTFYPLNQYQDVFVVNGNLPRSIYGGNFICISSVVVRRCFLDRVEGFTDSLFGTEDIDLWVRLAQVCKFCYWKEVSTSYHWQPASLSRISEKRIFELIRYHLYCKSSSKYAGMQDIVLDNLHYSYKLLILMYAQEWKPISAVQCFVRSLRVKLFPSLLLYVLLSFAGPIPLWIKLELVNPLVQRIRNIKVP